MDIAIFRSNIRMKNSSIELEKYKNNIMDKINHIRNNNETWDIEKKGKDKLTNSKSFSKNKK
jgi:hypothetical protein